MGRMLAEVGLILTSLAVEKGMTSHAMYVALYTDPCYTVCSDIFSRD